MKQVAILHGAGYVGRTLIDCVLAHPMLALSVVTSRSQAGKSLSGAHPHLMGATDLVFESELPGIENLDVVFVAAGHGQGAEAVGRLTDSGFSGLTVDMSADFRLPDAASYLERYGKEHPRPDLLHGAWYGMPEVTGPPPEGTNLIANPGCFATAISLALYPLSLAKIKARVSVTALTGASGSGVLAKETTHFPSRAGNVRAYKVFSHQHEAEIFQMAPEIGFDFVPISGPWTAGIWGTAQFQSSGENIAALYETAYSSHSLIRLWPNKLPELHWSIGTPFTDIGWIQKDNSVVVGFALDNLMKGAATQAIQNVNFALGFPQTTGLLPAQI